MKRIYIHNGVVVASAKNCPEPGNMKPAWEYRNKVDNSYHGLRTVSVDVKNHYLEAVFAWEESLMPVKNGSVLGNRIAIWMPEQLPKDEVYAFCKSDTQVDGYEEDGKFVVTKIVY